MAPKRDVDILNVRFMVIFFVTVVVFVVIFFVTMVVFVVIFFVTVVVFVLIVSVVKIGRERNTGASVVGLVIHACETACTEPAEAHRSITDAARGVGNAPSGSSNLRSAVRRRRPRPSTGPRRIRR